MFVAVGNWPYNTYGTFVNIGYSTDGINWSFILVGNQNRIWTSVTYGNGMFVAFNSMSNIAAYSTNGSSWTETTTGSSNRYWMSVCFGNGKFVAVAGGISSYATNKYVYSTNGTSWTEATIAGARAWYSVCFGNGKFVAVAQETSYCAYSTDGINWASSRIGTSNNNWRAVCYGDGKYVAQCAGYFAYSTDGANWTLVNKSSGCGAQGICYGNGKFVAVGMNGNLGTNSVYMYSTDGINWTEIGYANAYMYNICYGYDKFVVVCNCTATKVSLYSMWYPSNLNYI